MTQATRLWAARTWPALAAANGFMAVAAGAFAAHGVQDPHARDLLHTGAQYQLAHAVAALTCLALAGRVKGVSLAGWLFGVGGLVFAGSLYLLAATGARWLGAVTPLGGLMLLAGWAVLFGGLLRERGGGD